MPTFFRWTLFLAASITLVFSILWLSTQFKKSHEWTAEEIQILQTLWIGNLPPLAEDKSNKFANNLEAAEFGRHLFFDERFSHNAKISCATCHIPELYFTDGLKTAAGAQAGVRNTPTVVAMAYSPWQFWDGRKDSLWSQALAPLENELEHAATRMQFAHIIYEDEEYRLLYESLFPPLPNLANKDRFPAAAGPVKNKQWKQSWNEMRKHDREAVTNIFVNLSKALAAYQHRLVPAASRFDQYVEALIHQHEDKSSLTKQELAGLKLFIGKAQCINCHNGPLFTNNEFHNTGILSAPRQLPSMGRVHGVRETIKDEFNCLGVFSDASKDQCGEIIFAKQGDELIAAHKTPTLRNINLTAPYMHSGQLTTLEEVIEHYDQAPLALVGHNEIKPLELNYFEKKQLIKFLHSLSGPLAGDPIWQKNPHLLSDEQMNISKEIVAH